MAITRHGTAACAPLFRDNIDASVIDAGYSANQQLQARRSAERLSDGPEDRRRHWLKGVVVMTGSSAKVDATGKWFGTPLRAALRTYSVRSERILPV